MLGQKRSRVGWAGLVVLAVGTCAAVGEKQPQPWVQLKLEDLGIPAISASFLQAGASMLTVNLLDDTHLLVTYGERGLVPRVEGDPESHEDRMVGAAVVELPTGKVLARTDWHMHDHGRYLWSLGRGRFLVRMGDMLYTMTPLANLGAAEPLQRTTFGGPRAQPRAVLVSQDGGLLTIETERELPKVQRTVVFGDEAKNASPNTVTLVEFYRVSGDGSAASPLELTQAGKVASDRPFLLPVDADGYLWAEPLDASRWVVTFDGFGGKTLDVGKIDSSCDPRLEMVSPAEFVALTCQGTDDKLKLASYGLDGKETWEEMVSENGPPTLAYAPAAGRFAYSRMWEGSAGPASDPTLPQTTTHQEVRVYQNASGDLLLKLACDPIFKTGENFDLSADGLEVVVVRGASIAVYKLPPPTKRDREDMAEVAKFAPPASLAMVDLKRLAVKPAAAAVVASAPVAGGANEVGAPVASGGDAEPKRKPPTLLLPGEKAEFSPKKTAGQQ